MMFKTKAEFAELARGFDQEETISLLDEMSFLADYLKDMHSVVLGGQNRLVAGVAVAAL